MTHMIEIDHIIRIMFVCLGNICRSALAHGMFQKLIEEEGYAKYFEVASSGTGDWHVGQRPDARMRKTASRKGLSLDDLRAQQFERGDLATYDHIFVMDKGNLHDVLLLDESDQFGHKVRLIRELDPHPGDYQVPDPYYGGDHGFETVYDIVERTAKSLLNTLVDEYKLA